MARSKKAQAAADFAMSVNVPDSQAGLGVDIVEIEKMRAILGRTPAFASRNFSEEEQAYCDAKADPAKSYAARFAAKEAVLKALGCGFSQGIGPKDVEVAIADGGRPEAVLHGRAKALAGEKGVVEIALSLSHTATDAIACAIAMTEGSQVRPQESTDSMAVLAKDFKEARKMLDDIGGSPANEGDRAPGTRSGEDVAASADESFSASEDEDFDVCIDLSAGGDA